MLAGDRGEELVVEPALPVNQLYHGLKDILSETDTSLTQNAMPFKLRPSEIWFFFVDQPNTFTICVEINNSVSIMFQPCLYMTTSAC